MDTGDCMDKVKLSILAIGWTLLILKIVLIAVIAVIAVIMVILWISVKLR